MLLQKEIEKRNLPDLFTCRDGSKVSSLNDWKIRREEIKDIVSRECYGYMPALAPVLTPEVIIENDNAVCGKAISRHVILHIRHKSGFAGRICGPVKPRDTGIYIHPGKFDFPQKQGACPQPLSPICFSPFPVGKFLPLEEIIDHGYGVASFYYEEIALDRPGLEIQANSKDSWGALGRWAWACSRVLEYLLTVDEIDKDRIAVTGASRLGKTALWAAICDERFSMAVPMIDGTGGGALCRGQRAGKHRLQYQKQSPLVLRELHEILGQSRRTAF